jgi:hypothetical protein
LKFENSAQTKGALKMRYKSVTRVFGWVLLGIVSATAMALVLGVGVMWLWNGLMPDIFGLNVISYWQAVGLLVLSHLLLKGHHHDRRCDGNRARDASCRSDEERSFANRVHALVDEPAGDDTP